MLYNRVLDGTQRCLSERSGVHTIGQITCLEGYACALLVSVNRSSNEQSKRDYRVPLPIQSSDALERIESQWTRFHFRRTTEITRIVHSRKAEIPCRWIARSYGEEKIRTLFQSRDTRTVGCLPYRRTLSGFRVAERKHFSSLLPPSVTSRRASRSISRRKLRLVSKIKPRQWRYVALSRGRYRKCHVINSRRSKQSFTRVSIMTKTD